MQQSKQLYSFSLSNSIATDLKYLLNPSVRYVWIINHLPIETVKWHYSTVQINEKDVLTNVKVRSNVFELMIETVKFLEILPMFSKSGMCLLQMEKEVSNTLMNNNFPELPNYLIKNGVYCQYNLPHKGEVASFECIDENWIEKVAANEFIRPRIL